MTWVPERIVLARALIEAVSAFAMQPAGQEGYLPMGRGAPALAERLVGAGRETRAIHPPEAGERERDKAEQGWKGLLRPEAIAQAERWLGKFILMKSVCRRKGAGVSVS